MLDIKRILTGFLDDAWRVKDGFLSNLIFFSVVATDISNRMKVLKSVEAFIRTERKRSPKKIRLIFFRDSLRYISPKKCLVLFIRFIWISIHGMIASFVAVDKLPKRAFLFKAHQINFRDMHEVMTVTTGHYWLPTICLKVNLFILLLWNVNAYLAQCGSTN